MQKHELTEAQIRCGIVMPMPAFARWKGSRPILGKETSFWWPLQWSRRLDQSHLGIAWLHWSVGLLCIAPRAGSCILEDIKRVCLTSSDSRNDLQSVDFDTFLSGNIP